MPHAIGKCLFPIPPKCEQDEIVKWITAQTDPVQNGIHRQSAKYFNSPGTRTRLILRRRDGQLDVREAARHSSRRTEDFAPPSPTDAEVSEDTGMIEDDKSHEHNGHWQIGTCPIAPGMGPEAYIYAMAAENIAELNTTL